MNTFDAAAEDRIATQINDRNASRRLKEHFEYANKSHLTSAPGAVNSPDYKSMHQKEFNVVRDFDRDHQRKIRDLKQFLSSTTYSIGRKAATAGQSPISDKNFPRELEPLDNSPSNFLNPNLVKNLQFNSTNATPRDRFSTTNVGYTTAVKFKPKGEYTKKLLDEREHRLRMRDIVLGNHFEVGFDANNNCPSNEQM